MIKWTVIELRKTNDELFSILSGFSDNRFCLIVCRRINFLKPLTLSKINSYVI